MKHKKNFWKVKGSALLSSVLVLLTVLLFIKMYQEVYCFSLENNEMMIEYFSRK